MYQYKTESIKGSAYDLDNPDKCTEDIKFEEMSESVRCSKPNGHYGKHFSHITLHSNGKAFNVHMYWENEFDVEITNKIKEEHSINEVEIG